MMRPRMIVGRIKESDMWVLEESDKDHPHHKPSNVCKEGHSSPFMPKAKAPDT